MDKSIDNLGTLRDVVEQFSVAAILFSQAAELGALRPLGIDPVKVSLNRLAGELNKVAEKISSRGFPSASLLVTANIIADEAFFISQGILSDTKQKRVLMNALAVLTGNELGSFNNGVPAIPTKMPPLPASRPHRIANSNAPEKLAA